MEEFCEQQARDLLRLVDTTRDETKLLAVNLIADSVAEQLNRTKDILVTPHPSAIIREKAKVVKDYLQELQGLTLNTSGCKEILKHELKAIKTLLLQLEEQVQVGQ